MEASGESQLRTVQLRICMYKYKAITFAFTLMQCNSQSHVMAEVQDPGRVANFGVNLIAGNASA